MTAAFYKFDDEQSCPSQCFPARTSTRRRRHGGGHWLVAYRKAEEISYKNARKRLKETYKKQKNSSEVSEGSGGGILDKVLLLRLHCVDEPFELSSVDISELHLNAVKAEDLNLFDNVIYIDASINFLSLSHFSSFVSLRELNLSLNRLQDMTFDPADFPHLEVLDLSYNSLSVDAITAIGCLPCIRVLHLTGNQLHRFPPDLASSSNKTNHTLTSNEDKQFKSLEVLMLDDNKLSSEVFNRLANLKKLKHLNLQENRISEVPLLQLMEHLKLVSFSTESKARDTDENISDNLGKLEQIIQLKNWEDYEEASFPFPELQFLNLSGNKIAEEEALLAVALFPMLCEIDICSNPLTTRRRGDPPLLKYYLQEKMGIKIKRKDEQEVKTSVKVSMDPKWKVRDIIPNVSKRTEKVNAVTHVENNKKMVTQQSFNQTSGNETSHHFFVTEAADDLDLYLQSPAENQESTVDSNPEKLASYKTLTNDETYFCVEEPIGIQTAVRMPEHTLKNLNVYRDSKPKLDSIQTAYREQEKRIKTLPPPPAPPLKQQRERLDKMIGKIKQSKTMTEVPLTRVINRADVNKQEYKEAVSLLKDLKAKYKMVHRKTMEQVESLGSEKNTEQAPN